MNAWNDADGKSIAVSGKLPFFKYVFKNPVFTFHNFLLTFAGLDR